MKGWKQSHKWPELNTHEIGAVMRRYGEGAFANLMNSSESWPDDIASRQTECKVFGFDDDEFIHQASMLKSLSELAPLVCVVHSGFTSLEGWLLVRGMPKKKVRELFAYATSLGASPSNWSRSQPVCMPGGLRNGGIRQKIYYLNLQALEAEPWSS